MATHGTSPAARSQLPYDPIRDFTLMGMIAVTPNVLVVHAGSVPAASVPDFVAFVKGNPGHVSYGSAGQGSLTHLTMELFKLAAEALEPKPMSAAALEAKFHALADDVIGAERVGELFAALWATGASHDLRSIAALAQTLSSDP